MKRYIVFLPVFVWAIFFAGAEVKVENASIHRSGDSIRVSFKILVPSGTIASDYVQRLIPVIENGVDSLALDEIEIIGKRKQKVSHYITLVKNIFNKIIPVKSIAVCISAKKSLVPSFICFILVLPLPPV